MVASGASIAAAQSRAILVDTDAGTDDLMAIAYLASDSAVHLEAITVVNGLAHVDAGAHNVARLLELAGRREVPVFAGRREPLRGKAEFPAEWRRTSDDLPGVKLPTASRNVETRPAADYLIEHLKGRSGRVRILALGPLTNLAEAIQREPAVIDNIEEIVIMGGAIHAPGNLSDGDAFHTDNKTAEWNMFVDPFAARIVFSSGVKIQLVPLDATNTVPIRLPFLRELESHANLKLGRFVAQVLKTEQPLIEQGFFYAWDPLAAVALLDPSILKSVAVHIEVRQDAPEEGRTLVGAGKTNCRAAVQADADAFQKLFLQAFEK